MNIVVIQGVVLSVPQQRTLGSGELATSFDVVTEGPSGRLTVPVNWVTTVPALLVEGDEIAVIGQVRRRFFQSAGAVQSRTEVLASTVVPRRRRAAVRKILEQAREVLNDALVA
jgi:cytochrome c-type biogenesis protein CcmE